VRGTAKFLIVIVICVCAFAVSGETSSHSSQCRTSLEPENHAIVVDRLIRYHDSGEYDREIREVADDARDYLEARTKRASKDEKLAAVFDIDETSLSNWEVMAGCGFCSYPSQIKLYPNAQGSAIVPVLELFNYAKKSGIAIFFITGRQNSQRDSTIKNLSDAGYSGWTDLITQSDGNRQPARVFKSQNRQQIEDKGYHIILNIGDQASDLAGCCEERVFKLPNPFYLIN
jgi:predicted secreted acid phosphatase